MGLPGGGTGPVVVPLVVEPEVEVEDGCDDDGPLVDDEGLDEGGEEVGLDPGVVEPDPPGVLVGFDVDGSSAPPAQPATSIMAATRARARMRGSRERG